MPTNLVKLTIISIATIMVGAILAVIGLAKGPTVLLWAGIGLAAVGLILFIIEFIRTLHSR